MEGNQTEKAKGNYQNMGKLILQAIGICTLYVDNIQVYFKTWFGGKSLPLTAGSMGGKRTWLGRIYVMLNPNYA